MRRLTWCVVVLSVWAGVEFLYWSLFGWPVDWDELTTVISMLVIAVFTFPALDKREPSGEGD